MRSRFFVLTVALMIGCGGGGGESQPDAKVFMDAPPPDAAEAPTQLGKPCLLSMQGADCPSPATDGCLGPFVMGGTMGICTKICEMNGTFMTDANSTPTNVQPADLTTQNQTCVGAYQGAAIGTPSCTPGMGGIIFNRMPTGALQPNTNYTYQIACGIGCGSGNTCPPGLTCDTQLMSCVAQ